MKSMHAFVLSALSVVPFPLTADNTPPAPTAMEQNEIARGGEYRDQSLENREERAGDNGNLYREENLEKRQEDAENKQNERSDYPRD